jgi:hypothetical protein
MCWPRWTDPSKTEQKNQPTGQPAGRSIRQLLQKATTMPTDQTEARLSLEAQQEAYKRRKFMAMPIAGTIMWLAIGVCGALLPPQQAVWAVFIGTGMIFYLGVFLSRFTGENLLDSGSPKNSFDALFFLTLLMALLVFSIAIPFFLVDYSSLPLTVGILTGLMWVPLSWAIQHWVGLFHGVARTLLVTAAWFAFPADRFTLIPALIVLLYLVTLAILWRRWRVVNTQP